jgi:hypothetical protein
MTDDLSPTSVPPEEPSPDLPTEEKKGWKKVWIVLAAVLAVLLLVGAGLVFGGRALYSSTFDQLLAATEQAEGDPIWTSYFVAQDCFIDSVTEQQDLAMAEADVLTLAEQTMLLGDHVTTSLETFGELPVRVFQPRLVAARDAIHAHYQVWDEYLSVAGPLLGQVESDVTALPQVWDTWVAELVDSLDPIEQTFNDAEAAFKEAAPDEDAQQQVDQLFTASEAQCTRGSV